MNFFIWTEIWYHQIEYDGERHMFTFKAAADAPQASKAGDYYMKESPLIWANLGCILQKNISVLKESRRLSTEMFPNKKVLH